MKRDDRMWGADGEATIDGIHATDLGTSRMADVLTSLVKQALDGSLSAK